MHSWQHLLILPSITFLLLLEIFSSYKRYYGCLMMADKLSTPSTLRAFVPCTLYIAFAVLCIRVHLVPSSPGGSKASERSLHIPSRI